jgi:hypothetical protein
VKRNRQEFVIVGDVLLRDGAEVDRWDGRIPRARLQVDRRRIVAVEYGADEEAGEIEVQLGELRLGAFHRSGSSYEVGLKDAPARVSSFTEALMLHLSLCSLQNGQYHLPDGSIIHAY